MTKELTLSRRQLLAGGVGVAAAAALGTRASTALGTGESGEAFSDPKILPPDRIGIQLYTVRDQVSSVGFKTVFETLAAIGYKGIEFAGYTQGNGAITFPQIRTLMDDNGLVGIGSHVSPNAGNIDQLLDQAEILGLPYIGVSLVVPPNTTYAGW